VEEFLFLIDVFNKERNKHDYVIQKVKTEKKKYKTKETKKKKRLINNKVLKTKRKNNNICKILKSRCFIL
jgi:hypothetical protein